MEVEQQLLDKTEQKTIKKGEPRQDYLQRLAKAVDQLDEDAWDQLSGDTQAWYNKAVEAIKAKQEIVDFDPDDDDDAAADDEETAEAEAEQVEAKAATKKETTVAKTARIATNGGGEGDKKSRRVASPAARRVSKVRERSERKPSRVSKPRDGESPGAPALIRQMVMKNPESTAKDAREMLEQKGVECSSFTVSSVLAATKAVLRDAKTAGILKSGFEI